MEPKEATLEEAFEKLRAQGKNDQETVIQWMKDANLIGDKQQEEKAFKYLREAASVDKVDLKQFQYAIEEIAKDKRQSIADLHDKLSTHSAGLMDRLSSLKTSLQSLGTAGTSKMDEAFEKLRQQGKNNQETLINWMKEAKILADQKQEELAKQYFKETAEDKVDMERFKAVIEKVAKEKKQSVEDLQANLSAHSAKLMNAVQAGLDAFNKAMKK